MGLPIIPKATGGAAEQAAADSDPRARLRAARARVAKDKTRVFVLPGYDTDNTALGGQLVVRYKRLPFEDRKRIFITETDGKDVVDLNTQFLIEACDEILLRDKDGDHQLVPGHKTTFTIDMETGESLGSIMGVDHLPSVRAQLVEILGDNEQALNDHSGEVDRWMLAANAADGETALGES